MHADQFIRRLWCLLCLGIPFASLSRRCSIDVEGTAGDMKRERDLFDAAEQGERE